MQDSPIQLISPLEISTGDGTRVETFLGEQTPNGFQSYYSNGSFGRMCFYHYPGPDFDIWYSEYDIQGMQSSMHVEISRYWSCIFPLKKISCTSGTATIKAPTGKNNTSCPLLRS